MRLREGTAADLGGVYELVKLAHAEAPRYRQHALCMERIEHLGNLTQQSPDVFLYVVEHAGQLAGYLVGAVVESHFSAIRQACSISLFVHPGFRGTRAGYLLLRQLAAAGQERGAQEACISVSSGVCVSQTERLAAALGFENFGHSLVKQLPCQQ